MPRGVPKLSATQKAEIIHSEEPVDVLAERYDVSPGTVYRVRSRASTTAAKSGSKHSEADIAKALTAYVLAGGNATQACKQLQLSGALPGMQPPTLNDWAHRRRPQLEKIRADLIPRIHENIAAEYEDVAALGAQATREYLARARETMNEIAPRDMPGATRNLATVSAIATDKAALLRGRPTEITETRDVGEILSALKGLGVSVAVPGSEDLVDALPADAEEVRDLDGGKPVVES